MQVHQSPHDYVPSAEHLGWRSRGSCLLQLHPVVAEFDSKLEILWLGDSSGFVTGLTLGSASKAQAERVPWQPYSAFRAFPDIPCAVLCCGAAGPGTTAVAAHNCIRTYTAGGRCMTTFNLPPRLRLKTMQLMEDGRNVLFTSEERGVLQVDLATAERDTDVRHHSCGAHPITATRVVSSFLVTGSAGGEVVLRDASLASASLNALITIPTAALNKITAVDLVGTSLLVCASKGQNTSVVKVFDVRRADAPIAETTVTESVTWARWQQQPGRTAPTAYFMTPADLHIWDPSESGPNTAVSSITNYDRMTMPFSAAALSRNGTSLALASERGVLYTYSATATRGGCGGGGSPQSPVSEVPPAAPLGGATTVSATATPTALEGGASSASAGTIGGGATATPARGPLDAVLNFSNPTYPPLPQPMQRWVQHGIDSGFQKRVKDNPSGVGEAVINDRSADAPLMSDWPPPQYTILAVAPPSGPMPGPRGSKITRAHLSRAEAYHPSATDRFLRAFPDPFPLNLAVGSAPEGAPRIELLRLLKQELTQQSAAAVSRLPNAFTKLEAAKELCYHSDHRSGTAPLEWSRYNPGVDAPESVPFYVVGLDNSLPEASLMNAVVQALFHVQGCDPDGLRQQLMRHVCTKRYCVACELGALFSSMATQAVARELPIAQPSNFLRTLHHVLALQREEVSVRQPRTAVDAIARVHTVVRLLLRQIHEDLQEAKEHQLEGLGIPGPGTWDANITGSSNGRRGGGGGGNRDSSNGRMGFVERTFALALKDAHGNVYPGRDLAWPITDTAANMEAGLSEFIRQFESHGVEGTVSIHGLPPAMALLLNAEHGTLRPESQMNFTRTNEAYNYVHCGSLVHIAMHRDDPGHVIFQAKAMAPGHTPREVPNAKTEVEWLLINDYLVQSFHVPPGQGEKWELLQAPYVPSQLIATPIVAFYVSQKKVPASEAHLWRVQRPLLYDTCWRALIQSPEFGAEQLMPHRGETALEPPPEPMAPITSPDDILPTDVVAIDAEYVRLMWGNGPDAAAWGLDGGVGEDAAAARQAQTQALFSQRKPCMAPARISCILSSHDGDERLIMDDWIETPEPVQDYVTAYSGIFEGDLQAKTSKKQHLTTLKAAVLRLRCILDRGASFVGHGLPQDFRVMGLSVPKSQIIDTLELYHRQGHRKIALRFLAHHVLGERVQEHGGTAGHDSIEDARTALRLYRRYQELTDLGEFEDELDRVISEGHRSGWMLPDEDPTVAEARLGIASTGTTPTPTPDSVVVADGHGVFHSPASIASSGSSPSDDDETGAARPSVPTEDGAAASMTGGAILGDGSQSTGAMDSGSQPGSGAAADDLHHEEGESGSSGSWSSGSSSVYEEDDEEEGEDDATSSGSNATDEFEEEEEEDEDEEASGSSGATTPNNNNNSSVNSAAATAGGTPIASSPVTPAG